MDKMDDDFLIIGCESDDEIDSTCSDTSSDCEGLKEASRLPQAKSKAEGESDSSKRKRSTEHQVEGLTLDEELALTDSESEVDEQEESSKKKRRTGTEDPSKISDNLSEDSKEADIGYAIYSLGNYCPRMLRGVPCTKDRCSWVHYMLPSNAVSQLYRILANRFVIEELILHCQDVI